MDINEKVFYGESLYELEAYLDRLLARALEPYRYQLKEKWKASAIKDKIEKIFAQYFRERERLSLSEDHSESLNKEPEKIASKQICSILSEGIFQHFLATGIRPFFVIDFNVFCNDVRDEMFKIWKIIEI